MNVAMVISTSFPPEEGIGFYADNLASKLRDRGHDVTIVTRGSLRTERTSHDGLEVVKLPYVPAYPFHVDLHARPVNDYLRRRSDLDLVHVHTPLTPVVDVDLPVVSTVHTSVVEDVDQISSGGLRPLAMKCVTSVTSKRILAAQCEAADELTTVARSVKEELATHYGVTDVEVVGNGVDEAEFTPPSEPPDERYVLFVGRLSYRKGVLELVDAWTRVAPHHDVTLKVVGDGPLRERMESTARERGVESSVTFEGHIPRAELVRRFRNATLFVLPSRYEGLPTVLLEAMASGCPVVATDVSGCIDAIDPGDDGILVPPRDPERMAEAVRELLDDDDRRQELGASARETILEKFTWKEIADRYESIYGRVLE